MISWGRTFELGRCAALGVFSPSSVTASGGATFPREGEGFGDKQKPGGDDPPRGSGPTVHSSGKGEGRSVEPQAPPFLCCFLHLWKGLSDCKNFFALGVRKRTPFAPFSTMGRGGRLELLHSL